MLRQARLLGRGLAMPNRATPLPRRYSRTTPAREMSSSDLQQLAGGGINRPKEWDDFLEADLNHDGQVSKAEWDAFVRKKQMHMAGHSQGVTVGIPMSASELGKLFVAQGLEVAINGYQYQLKLEPVGETKAIIEEKLQRAGQVNAELEELEKQKQPLDARAARHAGRVMKGIVAYLVLQAAVVAKLTFYSRFGWDVMEPVTYFITFGTSLFGLSYFTWNKLEFSYPALAALVARRRAEKLYRKNGFDYGRFLALQRERADLKRHLDVLVPPRSMLGASNGSNLGASLGNSSSSSAPASSASTSTAGASA
jgi:hypothetical protein